MRAMSGTMAAKPEDGHRTKRLKLSQPKAGSHEGTGRFRLSEGGLVEEPLGSRGQSKGKSRSTSSNLIKAFRASTGNIDTDADQKAAAMLADVFSPTVESTPIALANGVATPPPSTDTPRTELDPATFSLPKRHVSGPGQFTPRALLKDEAAFDEIGVEAGRVLRLRGDAISWWMAEEVLRIHAFLENPQRGQPSSLDARPKGRLKDPRGKEVEYCCAEGGITHLAPCNMPAPPPAKESFGFATSLHDDIVAEHHASKGGINTIQFVADLTLAKLTGQSKIDEEEFKLIAGSENLRQYYGKGHKRYKAPDPSVDPTKQPILALKSFKKMAQNDELVEELKKKYAWALTNYQDLVGKPLPEPIGIVTPVEPSPAPTTAIAPALAVAPAHASTPVSKKRARASTGIPAQQRKIARKSPDAVKESPIHDARTSRRPEFPLLMLGSAESAKTAQAIHAICNLLQQIFKAQPTSLIESDGSHYTMDVPTVAKSSGRLAKHSRRCDNGTDDAANLLLTLANGGPLDSESELSDVDDDTILDALSEPFLLPDNEQLDDYIKALVEIVVSGVMTERAAQLPRDSKFRETLTEWLRQLREILSTIDLRVNVVVSPAHSQAISKLYALLLARVPKVNIYHCEAEWSEG